MQDPNYPRYQNQYDPRYQEQQAYYPDPNQEPPLDPAMERVRRKMIRLLAVSIGVMLIGLMAVLAAVVYKINKAPDKPEQEELHANRSDIPGQVAAAPKEPFKMVESKITLPEGTRLLSQSLSGNLISLETLLPDGGTEIIVYDFKESRIAARMILGNVE